MATILNDGQAIAEVLDANQVSDGYHTFGELYDHRCVLYIAFLEAYAPGFAWKSRKHADGTEQPGWFIAGVELTRGEPITYHIPDKYWEDLSVEERERAPEWDGHTSADVLARLLKWIRQ